MDHTEFRFQANQVIDRFKPRLRPEDLELLEIPLSGGELTYAIEDLVGIIINRSIVVTSADKDQLRNILEHMRKPDAIDIVNRFQTARHNSTTVT